VAGRALLAFSQRPSVGQPTILDRTDALFPVLTGSEHGHQPQPLPLDQHEPFLADIVAKAFFEAVKKISATDAFTRGDARGSYRFNQNRARTSGVALKSDTAADKSKDGFLRDFWGCSIFDFCNKIGTKRTWPLHLELFVLWVKTDIGIADVNLQRQTATPLQTYHVLRPKEAGP